MSKQKLVNPKGNWFTRAMGGFNPLKAGPALLFSGSALAVPWALNKANKDHTGTETMVQGGLNVAKDRPGGLMRGITGTADFVGDLAGKTWDFDRQGQWFGGLGKGKPGEIGSLAPNYEVVGGQVKKQKGSVLKEGEEEGGELISKSEAKIKKEEKEDKEMERWQTKLKDTEDAGNRLADRQLIRSQLADIPGILAAGNIMAADAAKHHSEMTTKAMAYIPQLELSPMKYQPMIDYGLSRLGNA